MKSLLGFLSFVLVVGGVSGLLREWIGTPPFFGFLRFLTPDGYEVYGNVVFVVLGIALGAAGKALGKRNSA